MNFLIIGSDTRAFVDDETDDEAFTDKDTDDAPPRSDTMMVLHADGDNSYAVSFPRDLLVNVPGWASQDQRRVQQGPAEGHRHAEGRTSTCRSTTTSR